MNKYKKVSDLSGTLDQFGMGPEQIYTKPYKKQQSVRCDRDPGLIWTGPWANLQETTQKTTKCPVLALGKFDLGPWPIYIKPHKKMTCPIWKGPWADLTTALGEFAHHNTNTYKTYRGQAKIQGLGPTTKPNEKRWSVRIDWDLVSNLWKAPPKKKKNEKE